MSNVLLITGGALVAFEAALVVLAPSPWTIGGLAFTSLMFVINFSAWRDQR